MRHRPNLSLPTHVSPMIQAISSDLERLVQLAHALADAARQETLPLFRMQLEVMQPKNLICPLGAGTKYGELITPASQRRSRNQGLHRDSPLARCNSDPEYRHSPISVRKGSRIDACWPQPPEDRSAQRPREAKRTLNLAARARRRVPIRLFLASDRSQWPDHPVLPGCARSHEDFNFPVLKGSPTRACPHRKQHHVHVQTMTVLQRDAGLRDAGSRVEQQRVAPKVI